ncbi:MAG: efflux RND transporter periplasmic adaptor subunit [Treponema sp.]|jgi:multidrug efflux pump subunit AcrA (membrane-fusion protein)|nr:efflux RND transporter periplasmic adaptor subunit [Treponema sp.]
MKRIIIHPLFLLLTVIGIVLTFSGCNQAKKGAAEAPQAAPEVPIFAVNTTMAVQGQIRDYLALSGDIVSGTTVDTFSDVAGKITRLYVSIGQRVSRNQAIAEVDPSRPGMNYLPGVARAPIAGTIVALPAQVGMTISQSMTLARIAGGNALELRVYVAERFISKIALRQPCEITLDAYPGELFRGSVVEISPVVDPASRTMEVKINVENRNAQLKSGMFAKVKIVTERKNNIVKLPAGALVQRFGKIYVFTAETDPSDPAFRVARQKVVVPGILVDGIAEIQEGLAADEEVIIRGQTLLEDGSRINVIDRVAPLSDTN